jgi:SnoaL-like domain
MTDWKVERLQDGLRRWSAGEDERALAEELYHPDIVVWATDETLNSGEYHGIDGALRWARAWNDAWEEIHYEPLEFIEVSEHILVTPIRVHAKARGGLELTQDMAWMFEFEGELVKRWELHNEKEAALASARVWLAGQSRQ